MKKRIHINRLGYMTGMPKTAVCCVTAGIFYLVDADKGINVYAGRLTRPFYDRESGDTVRLADFSDFNVRGRYFIRAGYRRSDTFEISDNPYKAVRGSIIDGIYLNRCGYDFSSDSRSGKYAHKPCHTGSIIGTSCDVSGGWHSAAGYSKYVSSACLALADMLYALKLFGESFSEEEKNTIIQECRWGLDWLLKMQSSDGGVHGSVHTLQIGTFVPPEEDENDYILGEKSSLSSLMFTAAAALASDYFKESDSSFSALLRKAAEKSWLWTVQTSEYEYYSSKNGSAATDGEGVYSLESQFMWAMCEMYRLTGYASFAEMIEKKYITSKFTGFNDESCGGFAALSYLLSDRPKNRTVEAFIRRRLTGRADRMWIADRESGYNTARSADNGFAYGSNFRILSDCMTFITAYLTSGEHNYLIGATDQFSYIFGKNPLDIAFMTGSGEYCCKSPCHRLSASSETGTAIPGMIVSGANTSRNDDYSRWHIERGSPPAKCYLDNAYSSSTNEPAVHFSAPVIFISAFYDKVGRSALTGLKKQNSSTD